jgi:hypothetical protein
VRGNQQQPVTLNSLVDLQRKKSLPANRRTAGESATAAAAAAASPQNKLERWKQKVPAVAAVATVLQKGERTEAAVKTFQRHLPAGRRPRTPDDDAQSNRSRGSKGSKPPSEAGERIRRFLAFVVHRTSA